MSSSSTKDKLKAGLLRLLRDKYLNQIQVNDVVKTAGVSRSSFYRSYDTVYDLLGEIEADFFAGFRKINQDSLHEEFNSDLQVVDKFILNSLGYLRENAEILLALSSPHGDAYFKEKVNGLLREYFLGKLAYNHIKLEHSDFYSVFTCAGHIDVLRYWLTERPDISDEKMAVIMAKLMYGYFFV